MGSVLRGNVVWTFRRILGEGRLGWSPQYVVYQMVLEGWRALLGEEMARVKKARGSSVLGGLVNTEEAVGRVCAFP